MLAAAPARRLRRRSPVGRSAFEMALPLILFGWLLMFVAALFWALQLLGRVYYGEWITVTLLDVWRELGFQAPRFEWTTAGRIVGWILGLSPGQALMLAGLILCVGTNLVADLGKDALKPQSRTRRTRG
jgi:hypothetical protein